MAPGTGSRFPRRCHAGAPPGKKRGVAVELSKEDLTAIEHALTRQRWAGVNVDGLLSRVRAELYGPDGVPAPRNVDEASFRVTVPKPQGSGWPVMRASSDDAPK